MTAKNTSEDVNNYIHLDQRSHVLAKSGMYIGNTKFNIQNEYIFKDNFIQLENINYNEGLVRIFLEILTNATDNVARSKTKNIEQKIINVNIDNKQWIEISNDGSCIPIELTKDKDGKEVYVPELLFGYLLSSSNYDDTKSRNGIGGTFGVGASLTNIFSKHFEVIIKNKDSQKEYKQIWKNNMSVKELPSIKNKDIKHNLITIKYLADFNYFGCTEYSDDIINHITKLIYDASLNSEINIKLNSNKIGIKNMLDYVKSYYNDNNDNKEFIEIKTSNSHLIIVPNYDKDNFDNTTISFVNGIFTFENGIHVNEFENIIFKHISEKLSKKNNIFNIKDIKPFFKIFIKCYYCYFFF